MGDYRIKVTVRNARLMRAFESLGETPTGWAKANGFQPSEICDLVAMKRRPVLTNGDWRKCVLALCEQANVMPSDLFSARQMETPLKKNSAETEVCDRHLEAYAPQQIEDPEAVYERQQIAEMVSGIVDRLAPRYQTALRMHADGASLEEIGSEIGGVTRERARQIVLRAQREVRMLARTKSGTRHLLEA